MTALELSQMPEPERNKINKVRCDYGTGTIDRISTNEKYRLVLDIGGQKVAVPYYTTIEIVEE